jgi:ADP-heptose:LPS heptosyltransferase
MLNKEWYPARFQSVVDAIKTKFDVIQIGSKADAPLNGVLDLRGKTTIREAAALLANSIIFVGLVGFLMHLARAVDCRSVIVYGGRERPWQSGYSANVNLTGDTPCSPCWRWNTCDFDHECMKLVSADAVIDAAFLQASRHGSPLECDTASL